MTSLSWKLDKPYDDNDDLPACASCRKRKLRCSRESPTCYHCSRTGTSCIYDSKQKPGLKLGAVEALSRRIGVLEQILLDQNGFPLVKFTANGTCVRLNQEHSCNPASDFLNDNKEPPRSDSDHGRGAVEVVPSADASTVLQHSDQERWSSESTCPRIENLPTARITDVRRQDIVSASTGPDGDYQVDDFVKGLPLRNILIKAIDYFCISFHHWIPFLHKNRIQAEVRKQSLGKNWLLVFHALVAVTLPHLDVADLGIGSDEVKRQSILSRDLVMKYAVQDVTTETLQALVTLVFEDLNNGELAKSYALIALLTRAVDFLQLTVEPGASRSRLLMKPLDSLDPVADWTDLESRRRLFWCIFLLDRYNSAHTGWNNSLTAEDVHRRLPADGAYFTTEKPVLCPFFGLWNKAYAQLSMSLAAHVPAQYNETERPLDNVSAASPSTTASSSAVDSSKIGAFAYCIEATESLNQITTFFLQQRIDWQNRQNVFEWLTRFKELDLRLVHWKVFLPPRWKDSNISSDKTLVNMDPNLTLAHLTHNASMILLHYPIASPPIEWTNLIQLPSVCSAETCHLAATEISYIASKFLQHSQIPFVNSQFSFCLFVAAKALLVFSQIAVRQVSPEFQNLIESLWTISARWRHQINDDDYQERAKQQKPMDVAARYAHFLGELRIKCSEDPEFRFDLLDHSCKRLDHSPRSPISIHQANITGEGFPSAHTVNSDEVGQIDRLEQTGSSNCHSGKRRKRSSSRSEQSHVTQHEENGSQYYVSPAGIGTVSQALNPSLNRQQYGHQPSGINSSLASASEFSQNRGWPYDNFQTPRSVPRDHTVDGTFSDGRSGVMGPPESVLEDDALFILSDTLMNPQYMELDRVITFEDANFCASDLRPMWPP